MSGHDLLIAVPATWQHYHSEIAHVSCNKMAAGIYAFHIGDSFEDLNTIRIAKGRFQ